MGILIFLLILIAIWQGFYWLGVEVFEAVKSYSVPSPFGVAQQFIELCKNGSLPRAAANSLLRGITGFLIAVVIGAALGLLDRKSVV